MLYALNELKGSRAPRIEKLPVYCPVPSRLDAGKGHAQQALSSDGEQINSRCAFICGGQQTSPDPRRHLKAIDLALIRDPILDIQRKRPDARSADCFRYR